ncbi:MAG: hypothetical protein J6Z49_04050 [Kiritimatiellae bacterium]|nr:hypothetical protein [Kiritimatiellia bacterium]
MNMVSVRLGIGTFGAIVIFNFSSLASPPQQQEQGVRRVFHGQIVAQGNGRISCDTQSVSVEVRRKLQRLAVQARGPKSAVLDKEGKRLRELISQQGLLINQLRQLKGDFVDNLNRDTDLDTTDDERESDGDGLSLEERTSIQNGEVTKKNILKMQRAVRRFQAISRKERY